MAVHRFVERYVDYLDDLHRPSVFSGPYARHFVFLLLFGVSPTFGVSGYVAAMICAMELVNIWARYRQYQIRREEAFGLSPILTVMVQANARLFRPGRLDLPALVVFTEDPVHERDTDYLVGLSRRIGALKGTEPDDADLLAVSRMVTDERAVMHRRRALPESFTGGPVVYLADLLIERRCLEEGYLTEPVVPALIEPGDKGVIRHLPWWIPANMDQPGKRSPNHSGAMR
jgi:hypothetical protein